MSQTKGFRLLYPHSHDQVKCIFSDSQQVVTCNFCAKYSFQCVVNTARKRRGPRPRVHAHQSTYADGKKQVRESTKTPTPFSPPAQVDGDVHRREQVSVSSNMSDQEDFGDSPPATWGKEKTESGFILFLEQLNSIEFDLPMFARQSPKNLIIVVSMSPPRLSVIVLSSSSHISIPNSNKFLLRR